MGRTSFAVENGRVIVFVPGAMAGRRASAAG